VLGSITVEEGRVPLAIEADTERPRKKRPRLKIALPRRRKRG
jgi:hypothetical protein